MLSIERTITLHNNHLSNQSSPIMWLYSINTWTHRCWGLITGQPGFRNAALVNKVMSVRPTTLPPHHLHPLMAFSGSKNYNLNHIDCHHRTDPPERTVVHRPMVDLPCPLLIYSLWLVPPLKLHSRTLKLEKVPTCSRNSPTTLKTTGCIHSCTQCMTTFGLHSYWIVEIIFTQHATGHSFWWQNKL